MSDIVSINVCRIKHNPVIIHNHKEADINMGSINSQSYSNMIAPIIVKPDDEDNYTIIDGHFRFNALRKKGAEEVNCIIFTGSKTEAQILTLLNSNTGTLNYVKIGKLIHSIQKEDKKLSNRKLAVILNCSEASIRNWLIYYDLSLKMDSELVRYLKADQVKLLKGKNKWFLDLIQLYLKELEKDLIHQESVLNNLKKDFTDHELFENESKEIRIQLNKIKNSISMIPSELLSLSNIENEIEEFKSTSIFPVSVKDFIKNDISPIIYSYKEDHENKTVSDRVALINQKVESFKRKYEHTFYIEEANNRLETVYPALRKYIINTTNPNFTKGQLSAQEVFHISNFPKAAQYVLSKIIHIQNIRREIIRLSNIENQEELILECWKLANQYNDEGDIEKIELFKCHNIQFNEEIKKQHKETEALYKMKAEEAKISIKESKNYKTQGETKKLAESIIQLMKPDKDMSKDSICVQDLMEYGGEKLEQILSQLEQVFRDEN